MQKCPVLTDIEFGSIVNGRWALSGASPEFIPITFNTNSIPVESYLFADFSFGTKVEALSKFGKEVVRTMLQKWENVCGKKISFKEIPSLKPLQAGMVIAGCSNLKEGVGATYANFDTNGNFYKVVICIPPNSNFTNVQEFEDYLNTVAHEIGHGIGLKHTHSLQTLLSRLTATAKGLGCSVMTYIDQLFYSEKTRCRGVKNCGETGFAIEPGPLDGEVCQKLYSAQYDMRRPSFLLQITYLGVVLFTAIVKTSLELIFTGFLKELKFQNERLIPEKYNDSVAELGMGLLLNYFKFPIEMQSATFAAAIAKILIHSESEEVSWTNKLITSLLTCMMLTYAIVHVIGSGDVQEITLTLLMMVTFKFLLPSVQYLDPSFLGEYAAHMANDVIEMTDQACSMLRQEHFSSSTTTNVEFFQSSTQPDTNVTITGQWHLTMSLGATQEIKNAVL